MLGGIIAFAVWVLYALIFEAPIIIWRLLRYTRGGYTARGYRPPRRRW